MRLPTVLFAEGGGGRPGDTDYAVVSALDTRAFALWGRLSGVVPRIAIVSGRCFAGNAVLAGASDLIVATQTHRARDGRAGDGRGRRPRHLRARRDRPDRRPERQRRRRRRRRRRGRGGRGRQAAHLLLPGSGRRVGRARPRSCCARSSPSAAAAPTTCSRRSRASPTSTRSPSCAPASRPRWSPRSRGSRAAPSASSPTTRCDSPARSPATAPTRRRGFMQLCDAFGLPILSLIDTPGMMVGPEAEATALVRHCSRLFVVGASLRVPFCRRDPAQGLRARRPGDGRRQPPRAAADGRLADRRARRDGPRGRGQARLSPRARRDRRRDRARRARSRQMVAHAHEHSKALNAATLFELDDVIDPAETRGLLARTLAAATAHPPGAAAPALRRHLVSAGSARPARRGSTAASIVADTSPRFAVAVALDLGQGELGVGDAVGEVVDDAERRVAQARLAGDDALRGHRHPDHLGVRRRSSGPRPGVSSRGPARLPVDAAVDRIDAGRGERATTSPRQPASNAATAMRGRARRARSACSASRAMKSSGQRIVPGPSSAIRPPTELSASTRSQPSSTQVAHRRRVVDLVRQHVAALRRRGGGSRSTRPRARRSRAPSCRRSLPAVPRPQSSLARLDGSCSRHWRSSAAGMAAGGDQHDRRQRQPDHLPRPDRRSATRRWSPTSPTTSASCPAASRASSATAASSPASAAG